MPVRFWTGTIIFLGVLMMLSGNGLASTKSSTQYKTLRDVPAAKWEELAKKKLYFAHQSVGYNIMGGLEIILAEHPEIKLNIVESSKDSSFEQPVFVHSKIGKNTKPLTKINGFTDVLAQGVGEKTDTAFLKLCYVDVKAETNTQSLFTAYTKAVADLQARFPNLTIIHFTVPLCVLEKTWKTRVKLMLGKEPWELADNAGRNEYNALLRREYGAAGTLFDIAEYEATRPDGSMQTFEFKGKEYQSMDPAYSSDGCHLNEAGSKMIAEKFLLYLAR
jgi:hypothetical protein